MLLRPPLSLHLMTYLRRHPLALCLLSAALLCSFPLARAESVVRILTRDAKSAPVADAVAWLIPLDAPAPPLTPPAEPVTITQEGEEFSPYVTPVAAGTRVLFTNRDKIQHHVYSLSKTKRFDVPLFGAETKPSVLFDQPGIVALGCNIHDWMSSYVVVVSTPYFAKTPADGAVTLTGLPPGKYRLEIWHPRLASDTRRDVTITAGEAPLQTISIVLKADRRVRRAPDAGGGAYK
jgi:plastocyanin